MNAHLRTMTATCWMSIGWFVASGCAQADDPAEVTSASLSASNLAPGPSPGNVQPSPLPSSPVLVGPVASGSSTSSSEASVTVVLPGPGPAAGGSTNRPEPGVDPVAGGGAAGDVSAGGGVAGQAAGRGGTVGSGATAGSITGGAGGGAPPASGGGGSTGDDPDECAADEESCDGECADLLMDPEHCGTCDTACSPGSECVNGFCECPDELSECEEQCVDTESNDQYCGNCETSCGPTETCVEGSCEAPSAEDCESAVAEYQAIVSNDTGTWTAVNGGNTVYSGNDMRAAMQAGLDSLTPGRSSKEAVLVRGSGSIDAQTRVSVPSYTIFNVCGTIDVTGSPSGDNAPVYARGQRDIEVPNVSITGVPAYGMFFRNVDNLHLGDVELRLTSGLGIRIDNHGDRSARSQNLQIDSVYVEGASNHGVETYGVENITIGTVVARHVGYSGLLLNDSANAEVGVVDGEDVATGQGYAVFRMANRNGRIGDGYPTNIHVERVIARGGGRGVFCVSESGGAVIDHVDLEDTGNNSVLLENCYNVTIGNADEQSRVVNSGELRIAARSEFANTSDITFQNILVRGTAVNENPCADGSSWIDIDADSGYDVCN